MEWRPNNAPTSRLASRLMAAQLLVIATGALTLVVASCSSHPRCSRAPDPDRRGLARKYSARRASVCVLVRDLARRGDGGLAHSGWAGVVVHRPPRCAAGRRTRRCSRCCRGRRLFGDRAHRWFRQRLTRLSDAFDHMANRLAATDATRTSMLADLAHELRTPLATLEAYIDGIEDQVVPADGTSYAVMRDQVARLRRLVVDLRESSAAEEHALGFVLTPLDANVIVRDSVAAAQPSYQTKGVQLQARLPTEPVPVRADASARSKCWPTCSTTLSATRHRVAVSKLRCCPSEVRQFRSRYRTAVRGSPLTKSNTSLNGSGAWTQPAP